MLEFTRDGASGGPFGRKMKNSCSQISMLKEIGGFSVRCFIHLRTPTGNKVESNLHTIASADVDKKLIKFFKTYLCLLFCCREH